jgi:hypothetical protein
MVFYRRASYLIGKSVKLDLRETDYGIEYGLELD